MSKPKYYVMADFIVDIGTPVEGGFKDWPAMLQDRIMKDIERESIARGRKYVLERAYCGTNDGIAFVHVIVKSPIELQ